MIGPLAAVRRSSVVERNDSNATTSSGSSGGGMDTPSGATPKTHHTRQGYPILPSSIQFMVAGHLVDASNDERQKVSPVVPAVEQGGPSTSTIQIPKLPSIPERSTYRLELQPGDVLPPRE